VSRFFRFRAGIATIQVTTERDVIRADGRSTTRISVQVRDDRGVFVPDGTRVRFSATAGQLETGVVETQGGVARVTLTAPNLPGVGIITINLEGVLQAAQTNVRITFSDDAETSETGTTGRRSRRYVAYLTDYNVIQANGRRRGKKSRARFEYRSLSVSADSLQFDVKQIFFRRWETSRCPGERERPDFNAFATILYRDRVPPRV
jgi:hypothetical protein